MTKIGKPRGLIDYCSLADERLERAGARVLADGLREPRPEVAQLDHDLGGHTGDARVHEQSEEGLPGAAKVEKGGGVRRRAAVKGGQGIRTVVHEHRDKYWCTRSKELKGTTKRYRSA